MREAYIDPKDAKAKWREKKPVSKPPLADAAGSASPRCVKYGCQQAELLYLIKGESRQTQNGFLIAKIDGWYCPHCAGGYGGNPAHKGFQCLVYAGYPEDGQMPEAPTQNKD